MNASKLIGVALTVAIGTAAWMLTKHYLGKKLNGAPKA